MAFMFRSGKAGVTFKPRTAGFRGVPPAGALLLSWFIAGCGGVTPSGPPSAPHALLAAPDADGERWVEEPLSSLSLREAIGQLIIPWMSGAYTSTTGTEFQEFARYVEEAGIGGVVISIGLPHTYGAKLNALQAVARVPLLVSSDFENGGPGMRINHSYALPTLLPQGGGTSFPPTMAFGAIGEDRFAWEYGRVTAVEARAVGVHLNFAPVLDVNSNPLNPIINTRSFGEDPEAVAGLGAAYLAGAEEGGLLTTAKHFPGHGDTKTDSHVELPIVDADRERLEALELIPFRRAVAEGVDAVMTAHVAVPGVLGPDGPPATLSPFFLTELLREDMAFDGLLLTDALRMRAISDGYGVGEAAVLAVEAGADVILAPADVWVTLDALEEAVFSGRISRERLDSSVRRILEMKARVGLHRNRYVNLDRIGQVVASSEHLALADSAATRSVTLPRDRDDLIPADPSHYSNVLHVVYARGEDLTAGRALSSALGAYFRGLTTRRLTPESPAAMYRDLAWARGGSDLVVVSAFVPPRAGAGEVAVPEPLARFVEESSEGRPTIVLSLGNPYLLSSFPEVGTYLLAWGPHEVSQRAAARALVGESAISGRLPISLPPFHRIGEGLARARVPEVQRLGAASEQELEIGLSRRPQGGALSGGSGEGGRDPVVSPLEVDPADVGLDPEALEALDSLILAALADSASPGAALAVGRKGRLVRLRGYGHLDWGENAPLAKPSSLWDMASVTKVSATTSAAMVLAEAGRLDLDAEVVRYLPWWSSGDPEKENVTVRHLLLHRAGLPPFRRFFLEMEGEEDFKRAIAGLPLDYTPGDSTVYSDIGLMTLAFIVEQITGTDLDSFLQTRLWRPLGMQDTGFRPDPALLPRIAPTEVDTTYRFTKVHGVVHDENAFAIGGVAGHAGLFSSARDMAVLAQALLDGGVVPPCPGEPGSGVACSAPRPGPVRVVAPTTVELFTRRHDSTASRALGWDTPRSGSSSGDYLSERAFGHTGFTGTSIWVDPELDLFVVLLTSRTNPTRNNSRHVPLRRAVHDAVAQAVTDRNVQPRRR
jgi:beta-glucosidase-like glycosyl hydrolase/CubicO group peptidase (beta-lactamase class C family)